MAPVKVKISFRYGSHIPVLYQVLSKTKGDVLELGSGFFSTPWLHWICTLQKRNLVTMEDNRRWHGWFSIYEGKYHKVIRVRDWKDADIERMWDVVLVDHSPDFRRKEEAKRLANLAKYIIIHDSNGKYDNVYRYSQIYPLFKYVRTWDKSDPTTTVLSNFVNLDDLWEEE